MNYDNKYAENVLHILAQRKGFDILIDNLEPEIVQSIINDLNKFIFNPLFTELLFLEALRVCGVDNWGGYSEALKCADEWSKGNIDYMPYS